MASDATPEAAVEETYDAVLERARQYINVEQASRQLQWDQEVVMPEAGTTARSRQLSALSAVSHDLLTDEEMADGLARLEEADLEGDRAANVRELRRRHDRAASVPRDLVEDISAATTEAHPEWKRAKEAADFSTFEPALAELVDLKREYAAHVDADADPYAVLFAEYEPYVDIETADRVLTRLRDELVDLLAAVRESDAAPDRAPIDGEFDVDAQEELSRRILDELGYDWDRGRLDTAPHPFTSGNQHDCRVTTRFQADDLAGGLMATIHEFGHANYTLGLPRDAYGTPVGQARDMTVHESQSRFWENHVGRSRPFWERFLPTAREYVDGLDEATPDEVSGALNRVRPDNPIRVAADELTYHLHIVVRYEIERDLIRGDLDVSEVPAVWTDKYEEYLGVTPADDAEGPLQDIHWSHGSFGYFPTYSLGSVLAAQIDAAIREDLDVDAAVREGEFGRIREWLAENVHGHGCRYRTDELIRRATGDDLAADAFLAYAREKFGALYDL